MNSLFSFSTMLQLSKGVRMSYSYSMEAAIAHYPDAFKIVRQGSGVIVYLTELTYQYHKTVLKSY